jgi:hypothetical protein
MEHGMSEDYLRQLAVVWPEEWERIQEWYRSRGLYLFRIPDSEDGDHIPTYGIGVSDELMRAVTPHQDNPTPGGEG